ncbi:EF-P 5-aminopentanol modification-associated protein YfmF [Alteribacillus iranensis]|uniref:Predicted Zn-dependent peptidase n=1 Tax=Alteribacillus iranensis TaxID=930128 RepID=A0A1I2A1T5_9BACI|nr:pitrilysin family protein [Alteribacillus iranensis]SFE37881.1 Predicted Zn-dependent peptidase [Alteribacillus iranensis]
MLDENVMNNKGLHIHLLSTPKYKTTTIALQIRSNLSRETATERALLTQVLKSATKSLPSRKEIRRYLDELYGASFSADVQKKGEQHIISLKMELANEKYLRDTTPLFEKGLHFLREVVEEPSFESDHTFSEKVIHEEKRTLKQRLHSIYDDKIRYANQRLLEIMCEDEPFSVHPFGILERVDQITNEDLINEYKRMLNEDDFRLYIVGDVSEEEVQKASNTFTIQSRESSNFSTRPSPIKREETQEVKETDDIQQGKLHLGYRTSITFDDDNFTAMQVLNGLFGGFPHSKLFLNVREKESLAYYAASRYESHKGLVLVFAGIEASNYEKAMKIIDEQLVDIQEGQFSEEAIKQTKSMLKNQLLETADSARGVIELYYQGIIGNKKRNLDDWLQEIEKVTREDVISCARELHLDTRYFLHGKESN